MAKSQKQLFDYTGQDYIGEHEEPKVRATTAAQKVVLDKIEASGRRGVELGADDYKLAHKLWLNTLVEYRHPELTTRRLWYMAGLSEPKRKLWTNSRSRAERLCNYWGHIKYNLGYRETKEAEPLWFGSLVHLGLETWWQTGGDLKAAITSMGVTGDPERKVMYVMARVMMTAYHHKWIKDIDLFELVGVEVQFEVRLKNPETGGVSRTWDLGGKMDAVVRFKKSGVLWIIEHKTTSEEIGHDATIYGIRLLMDTQTSQYWLAAELKYGEKIGGVIFDVLRKPGIRPSADLDSKKRKRRKIKLDIDVRHETDEELETRRAETGKKNRRMEVPVNPLEPATRDETDGEMYDRIPARPETNEEYAVRLEAEFAREDRVHLWRTPVYRTEADLVDYQQDAWDLTTMSHERFRRGKHPKNPDQCMHHGRPCALLDHCATLSDLDADPRWVKSEWVHPELSEEAASV
ncbi:MAG: hypothetical protein ACI88C_000071 [Acidimicrobiales bacterium]|jgi:hypothetical protein